MRFYFKPIVLILGLFLFFGNPSNSMDPEENQYILSPSLNFTYNEQVALDEEGLYNSDKISDWHMQQAPILTVAYQNYQRTPRRNVQKLMVSIIYTENDKLKIKIFH